ncbi:MAG: hypothetical protein OIN66_10860 [Candidatus Methanoperedens sp.]|nr:hypothetical protein [Candidatus Methanoperedens sp.]
MAYVATSPRSNTEQETQKPESQQEKYNPEFWTMNQPFNSISDALNMTPPDAVSASYIDLESMTPQMTQWSKEVKIDLIDYPFITWMDSLYKSNTTKAYYGHLKKDMNESFLLLSTMSPERNDFEYIVPPWAPYKNQYVLIRQEPGINGIFNVMGSPTVFAQPQTAIDVIDITTSLNKTATAYDQYEGLLSRVEPAPFQTLSSNVSFAKQYYTGIRLSNGSYEKTAAYLNLNSSTLKKLNQLKDNSTQRGILQYNITKSGNYTIVKITGQDMFGVISEETS